MKRYYFTKGSVKLRTKPCLVIDNPPELTKVCTKTYCLTRAFINGPLTENPALFEEVSEEKAIKLIILWGFDTNPRD